MALVITDFSEERIISIIRVTRIGELRTTLAIIATEDGGGDTFHRNVGSYKRHTA
jgi:hypothetical protein